jgi:diaminopimelate epimerase
MRAAAAFLPFLPTAVLSFATTKPSLSYLASSSGLMAYKLGDTIDFAKYEGLGNDFILIDDRDKSDPSLTPEQSERLCNRNFGIGGDGVIFALKAPEGEL